MSTLRLEKEMNSSCMEKPSKFNLYDPWWNFNAPSIHNVRKEIKEYRLRNIKSYIRNFLQCPADFITYIDRHCLAFQKALKNNSQPLFDEVMEDLANEYKRYCKANQLFFYDDNRRWKKVTSDQREGCGHYDRTAIS